MKRLDSAKFEVATRGTSREINSRIVLNLVRAHQPISRADLARTMDVRRGVVTLIVNDLLKRKLLVEGATGEAVRGRKPTFLYINSRHRAVVAVDIRASETYLLLADLLGKAISGVIAFRTDRDPKQLTATLAERIKRLLAEHPDIEECEGIGVVVPGMVEHSSMRVLHAPTLGWRNVSLREQLSTATGLPVQIENSGRACALAQMWATRNSPMPPVGDLVFVSVSDGVAPLLIGFVIAAHAPNAAQISSKPVVSKVDARNATKSTNLQTRSSAQLGKKTKAVAREKYTVAGRTAPLPPAQLTDTAKPVTEKAKASIAAMLLNPASAEFYNLKRAVKKMLDEPVDTICGYVKGKNASGGDTEEMPFLYIIRDDRDGEAYLVDGRSYVAQTVHGVLCK